MFMEEIMFSRSGKIIPVARNSTVKVKENALYGYTEPIKGHGGGKKVVVGGKNIFQFFCIPSQNIFILSQKQLSSDKHFLFTAFIGSCAVCSQCSFQRVILNLDSCSL